MMVVRVVAALLLVVALAQAQVFITTQPQPQFVVMNSQSATVAQLSCTITGTGGSTGNYARRWFVSYNKGATFVSFPETTSNTVGQSVTTSFTVTLPSNPIGTYPDGYLVYAGFRNTNPTLPYDAFSSNTVAITIIKSPVIVVQPLDVLVDSGATATFNVTATGNIPTDINGVPLNSLSYQWQVAVDTSLTWTSIAGATSPIYTTAATAPTNNFARYRCLVGYSTAVPGIVATATNVAVLRVAYITVTAQPSSASVNEFSQATFTVAYTSYPQATVLWKQSATLDVPGGSGAQTTTYTTAPTTYAMNGLSFTAFINNGRTTVLAGPASLTVNRRLVITQQPANITVSAPASASFVVGATGTSPISYQWQVSSDGISWNNVADPSAITTTLALQSTTRAMNQLRYRVLVSLTDALGTTTLTSNVAFLTVLYAPVILTQPIRPLVITGDLVTLVVVVDANPPATYNWQSAQINTPASFSNVAVDSTGPSYRVTSIPVLDSIFYRVIASNSQGSATSNVVELRVNFPRAP